MSTKVIDPSSPATVELSTVREIMEDLRASGATTVEQRLRLLFDKFNTAVRAVDPSITGAWIGYDAAYETLPTTITFERPGAELFRRSA